MGNTYDVTPSKYRQPISPYKGRDLDGTLESVDYVPRTHLRIWYNNQTEGYARHHHAAMEIILVKQNLYPVTVNNTTYMLSEGDILFIPPNTLHSLAGGAGSRFVMLFDVAPLMSFEDMRVCCPIVLAPVLLRRNDAPGLYKTVRSGFDRLISLYFESGSLWELRVYAELISIFSEIGADYINQADTDISRLSRKAPLSSEKFASLLSYIDSHYTEDLTLDWAAGYTGFSKYHFLRLFSDYTGCTFHDYLLQKRIQIAQALLATDVSITEAALRSGYSSLTTFNRNFRKLTGMSPSEYRNAREAKTVHEGFPGATVPEDVFISLTP